MEQDLINKIYIYKLGLYDEDRRVRYDSNLTSSAINDIANSEAEVIRLSQHMKNQKITFIKMDIEGSELKALVGAKDILKNYKPKLAISIYHKPCHMWEIPLYLKKLFQNIKYI